MNLMPSFFNLFLKIDFIPSIILFILQHIPFHFVFQLFLKLSSHLHVFKFMISSYQITFPIYPESFSPQFFPSKPEFAFDNSFQYFPKPLNFPNFALKHYLSPVSSAPNNHFYYFSTQVLVFLPNNCLLNFSRIEFIL